MTRIERIKNRIEKELPLFMEDIDQRFNLRDLSPIIFDHIQEFLLRKGKRIRPLLFIISFEGYSRKLPKKLYTTALSLELLHNFMLIHDDIIDKSSIRRGKPSMHCAMQKYLSNNKKLPFNGKDLALIIGDIMYALSLYTFTSIEVCADTKLEAMELFTRAAVLTGSGEFTELFSGLESIENISEESIYQLYDLKTAFYSFSYPIALGALFNGSNKSEIAACIKCGQFLGRAYQIHDDIKGVFGKTKETGKPVTDDLLNMKRTLLLFHAFSSVSTKEQKIIADFLSSHRADKHFSKIKRILKSSGTIEYALNKSALFQEKGIEILDTLSMKKTNKEDIKALITDLFK